MFRNLSFRYKIPLRATLLVLITTFLLTIAIVVREYEQMRSDIFDNAESLGQLLVHTLVTPIQHDDLWRAFEIINIPAHANKPSSLAADLLLVLDAEQRVLVSSQPREHPVTTPLAELGENYAILADEIGQLGLYASRAVELPDSGYFHLLMPIVSDGVSVGVLLMEYPKSIYTPRFYSIVTRALFVTLLVLSVLLPLSWYWGRRMAEPLVKLADCMGMVGERIPDTTECRLYQSRDEIGQAGAQLKRMLLALGEKQALEQQIIASERLAAIGRITAGIAHEINNPLGGMLNTISTWKRHRQPEHLVEKTLPLLERGLLQIKETVAALLVEARVQSHPLTDADLHDIQTLLQPHIHSKRLQLHWEGSLTEAVALPSTQVRQVLMNLLLNAIQAADPASVVLCSTELRDSSLLIRVENQGEPIPAEQHAHLFEPFVSHSPQGHGLGLWVTYQLVQQMHGEIYVNSLASGTTVFVVSLPLGDVKHA